jgi:hypothetical protein
VLDDRSNKKASNAITMATSTGLVCNGVASGMTAEEMRREQRENNRRDDSVNSERTRHRQRLARDCDRSAARRPPDESVTDQSCVPSQGAFTRYGINQKLTASSTSGEKNANPGVKAFASADIGDPLAGFCL